MSWIYLKKYRYVFAFDIPFSSTLKQYTFYIEIQCWEDTDMLTLLYLCQTSLTHYQLETHGCILSTLATDTLVLKHQAISTHSAKYWLYWTSFIQIYYSYREQQ